MAQTYLPCKNRSVVAAGFLEGQLYGIKIERMDVNTEILFVSSIPLWHEPMAYVDKRGIVEMYIH